MVGVIGFKLLIVHKHMQILSVKPWPYDTYFPSDLLIYTKMPEELQINNYQIQQFVDIPK